MQTKQSMQLVRHFWLIPLIKKQEIAHNDLSKEQLTALKDAYIDRRLKAMSELELRKFVHDVLDLQVHGTVGNDEEREVWREMKNHFEDGFIAKIKEICKEKPTSQVNLEEEEKDFQQRLELLEKRKSEGSQKTEDMWNDDWIRKENQGLS